VLPRLALPGRALVVVLVDEVPFLPSPDKGGDLFTTGAAAVEENGSLGCGEEVVGVVVISDADAGEVAGVGAVVLVVVVAAVVVGGGNTGAGGAAHSQTKLPANVGMELQTNGLVLAWAHLLTVQRWHNRDGGGGGLVMTREVGGWPQYHHRGRICKIGHSCEAGCEEHVCATTGLTLSSARTLLTSGAKKRGD
jgi:hypothetical protein